MQQRQSSRAAWPALGTAAAGVVLFGALAHMLPPEAALAAPAPVEVTMPAVRHCPYCGWIESKREIVPSVADPDAVQVYEYTVRMRDGSASVFEQTLPASWRLGERVMVIDSATDLE